MLEGGMVVRSGITDFKRGWKNELARRLALFEGRPQRNHRFLKGLNLPIGALGTGRIALLKDVRSGITDFKRGWKSELARRLPLFEGRPQRNHRFVEGP